jgi:hypothetical protein
LLGILNRYSPPNKSTFRSILRLIEFIEKKIASIFMILIHYEFLPPFQIINRFDIFKYIVFTMYLDMCISKCIKKL